MAKTYVSDLRPNDQIKSAFAIRQKRLLPFRNKPGYFLDLVLADRTGEIPARIWDGAEQADGQLSVGDVIEVVGRVEQYQGRLQLIIHATRRLEPGEYDRADFIGHSKADPKALLQRLRFWISEVRNPHLRALLQAFFGDEPFLRRFAECPGSKQLHHAYVGGLLEHTVAVAELLDAACRVHPELDRDLLIAGALLHDIGKVHELELLGATIEYTDIGRLVGHVVLTDRMVTEKLAQMPDFPPELAARLTHLLLSHHGQKEYGAPVLPMTPEACALHYADNLDAHVRYFSEVVEAGTPGNRWSEYLELFDRYIYIGNQPSGDEQQDKGE